MSPPYYGTSAVTAAPGPTYREQVALEALRLILTGELADRMQTLRSADAEDSSPEAEAARVAGQAWALADAMDAERQRRLAR